MNSIKLFESKKIRSVWNEADQKWYFVVADVIQVLTDSANTKDYIKKLRRRDPELAKGWGQIVPPLSILTEGGPQFLGCANVENLLRIIQSIPSPKSEPFKRWLAKVGYERLEEIENPELATRDHMNDLELIFSMLGEASTTEIVKTIHPEGFDENREVANEGGSIAGDARKALEKKTGKKIVSKQNFLPSK